MAFFASGMFLMGFWIGYICKSDRITVVKDATIDSEDESHAQYTRDAHSQYIIQQIQTVPSEVPQGVQSSSTPSAPPLIDVSIPPPYLLPAYAEKGPAPTPMGISIHEHV